MSRGARVVVAVLGVLAAAGCVTGQQPVPGTGTFEFVAPGGKTTIDYDGAQRRRLPELSGDSLTEQGKQVKLSDYSGKVVVINIWGSWCGPCRAEAPELQRVYQQASSAGLQVLGVDVRDDRDAALDFYRNQKLTYPSLFDPPGRSLLALKGYPRTSTPTTLVLDRGHRVAWVSLLPLQTDQFEGKVRQVLAER
ncbi:MAG: TlpA family protein disulfide reductase [Kutzneria sp.]|nr:TlpA family protein disulfide reductase [Kutzneria sp.]MBV9845066.1 TlpA family protein disulfide reductase [Kutzneria sp.]